METTTNAIKTNGTELEFAISSARHDVERHTKSLKSNMESLSRELARSLEDMDRGRTPNACGVVQARGSAIDMDVAKLEAAKNALAMLEMIAKRITD